MKNNYIFHFLTSFKKIHEASIRFMLIALMLSASSFSNHLFSAGVVITAPSLFDTAKCSFPTPLVTLDDIVIAENAVGDFGIGANKTFSLTVPNGFQFSGVGVTASFTGADITAITVPTDNAAQIVIKYTVVATAVLNTITIHNIQVQATSKPLVNPANLTRSGGTALINGDIAGTVHATFTLIAKDPTITAQPVLSSPCEGTDAYFSVSTYITPAFTYLWQENQGSGWVSLVEGYPYINVNSYSVTIQAGLLSMSGYRYRCLLTGADGSCTSNPAFLIINTPPAIVLDPTNATVCEESSTSFSVTASGYGLFYNWSVSTDSGQTFNPVVIAPPYSIDGGTPNFLYLTNTPFSFNKYQYQCDVGGLCPPQPVSSAPAILTVNPKPVVLTVADTICSPGTFNLTLPGVKAGSTLAGVPYAFSYTYFTNPAATIPVITPTAVGDGTYYLVGNVPATGCRDTTALLETVNHKPLVAVTTPAAVCWPDTIDITLPAVIAGSDIGLTYSYFTDPGATLSYAAPTRADSGSYYIVGVIPLTGCSDTTKVTATINPKPNLITVTQTACAPAKANLTLPAVKAGSTPGLSYTYFTDAGASSSYPTPAAATAGVYYIVGKIAATTCADTTPVTVVTNTKPILVTTNPPDVCWPATVDLTLPADTAGSTAGIDLSYFTDAAATIHIADSSAVGVSGIYYIVGVKPISGCSDTTAITVTINPKPTLVITAPPPVCFPGTVDLTFPPDTAGSTAGLTLSYFIDAGAITHIADSSAASAGAYYIVGVLPSTGCSDTTAITATVDPKPVLVITNPAAVCFPTKVDLTFPADTAGSTAGLTLSYFTNAAATIHPADSSAVGAGPYYIVGILPATGCSDTALIIVTVNTKPTLVVTNPAAVCFPATVDLTFPPDTAGSTAGLTLSYFIDAGATTRIADSSAVSAGTYYIVGMEATGCSDTAAITVTVNPKPNLVITNPAPVCFPAIVDLTFPPDTAGSTAGLTLSYFTDAGATTHVADSSAVSTGTYYIVGVLPATGCSDTAAIIVTSNPKPTLVITNPAAVCFPAAVDLTFPADTAGSTAGLTLSYFTDAGATTHIADSSAAGAGTYYIVGFLAATGCSDTAAIVVTVNSKPSLVITDPNDLCFPARADLTFPADTAGSTAGLTLSYYTDAGATTHIADSSSAAAGTYYIVGVDAAGCSDTAEINVTVYPKPILVTINPPAVCFPATVDLTLPADTVGSTSGLTLSYFTNASATTLLGAPTAAGSGTYYIVGAAASGCSDTTAITVTVNPKPSVITVPQETCSPGTVDLTLPSVTASSTAGLTFNYFTNAGATAYIADSSAAGAGTYYIVGVIAGGCSDTTAVTVTIDAKPIVITVPPAPICLPATIDLTSSAVTAGSTPGLTFSYFTDTAATLLYATPAAAAPGTYFIVGTLPATGCSDTTAITVTGSVKPDVLTTNPAAVCFPATVDLTLPAVTAGSTPPGITYTYFLDAGAVAPLLNSAAVTASGIYYIVGTVPATGCSDTAAVNVSVAIGGAVVNDAIVCSGSNADTLKLTGFSGTIQNWQSSTDAGATWSFISNTTAQQYYSNLTVSTWYRAVLTGLCPSATSIEARITVDSSPIPIGGTVSANDTVCSGLNHDTLTLSGHSGNIIRWEYSNDGANTWVYINNTTASLVYNNLTATTIFHAIVQNSICSFAVSSNDTITVTPISNAGIISGAVYGCAYANAGILTLGGHTGSVVKWQYSADNGTTWTDTANITTTQVYTNLPDTIFYRSIVKSGVCPADTSAASVIIVYPKPTAAFTADTACLGGITAFVNASSVVSGAIQFNEWDFGDNISSLSVNPTHFYTQSGPNTVNLITISNFGCLDTAAMGVFVNPLPDSQIIASGPLSFCCGGSVTLSAVVPGLNYLWTVSSATTQSIVVNNCLSSGIYGITVTDPATLCTSTSSVSVSISPIPVANAGNDTTINLGSSFTINSQGGITYSWSPSAGLSNPFIPSPIAGPLVTTTYELTVIDLNGCSDVDSLTITVIADYNVDVTNLLTANGDGYNDLWIIKNIENYPGTEVIVVNREGQQVFYSSSYDNTWTGLNKNSKPLPDGTYYYFIKFKNSNKVYKGPLTILNEK